MKTIWRLLLLLVAEVGAALQVRLTLTLESWRLDLQGDLEFMSVSSELYDGETEAQRERTCLEGHRGANGRDRPKMQHPLPSKCFYIDSQDARHHC